MNTHSFPQTTPPDPRTPFDTIPHPVSGYTYSHLWTMVQVSLPLITMRFRQCLFKCIQACRLAGLIQPLTWVPCIVKQNCVSLQSPFRENPLFKISCLQVIGCVYIYNQMHCGKGHAKQRDSQTTPRSNSLTSLGWKKQSLGSRLYLGATENTLL